MADIDPDTSIVRKSVDIKAITRENISDSAFLGAPGFAGIGHSDIELRGFRKNRLAGDASLYGNSELRLVLARIKNLVYLRASFMF